MDIFHQKSPVFSFLLQKPRSTSSHRQACISSWQRTAGSDGGLRPRPGCVSTSRHTAAHLTPLVLCPSGAVGGRCVYSPCLITLWKIGIYQVSKARVKDIHWVPMCRSCSRWSGTVEVRTHPPGELRARWKDEVNSQGWVHGTGRPRGSDAHAWQGTWLFWASWQISISFSFLLELWRNLLMHKFTKDDIWRGSRGYVRGLRMLGFPF